jgi:drug/metabolite transporter (DMT)-like permease
MDDLSWVLWQLISIVLPVASLAVLVAGLLRRRERPTWLLWCAFAIPTAALAILLILIRAEGTDWLMLALTCWFVLCLLVLGIALGRRWRGEDGRTLEIIGLVMPFVVLALLAGLFMIELLTPIRGGEHPAVEFDSRPTGVADVASLAMDSEIGAGSVAAWVR